MNNILILSILLFIILLIIMIYRKKNIIYRKKNIIYKKKNIIEEEIVNKNYNPKTQYLIQEMADWGNDNHIYNYY